MLSTSAAGAVTETSPDRTDGWTAGVTDNRPHRPAAALTGRPGRHRRSAAVTNGTERRVTRAASGPRLAPPAAAAADRPERAGPRGTDAFLVTRRGEPCQRLHVMAAGRGRTDIGDVLPTEAL